jgi:hypothetical protein
MKTFLRFTIATAVLLMTELGCLAQHYNQTNLVSNSSSAAAVADPQLINPWGLSRGSGSAWWVGRSAREMSAPRTMMRQPRPRQSCISLPDRTVAREDCSVI